jgi:hypothetical protein
VEPDPAPVLAILERLDAAWGHPTALVDVMAIASIQKRIDRTYLLLAVRGQCPATCAERWIDAGSDLRRRMADALARERLLCAAMTRTTTFAGLYAHARMFDAGGKRLMDRSRAALLGSAQWILVGFQGASAISVAAHHEAELRGLPTRPPTRMPWGLDEAADQIDIISERSRTNLISAILRRVAVRIVMTERAGQPLPEIVADLSANVPAALLAGHPAMEAIHLGGRRFRVGVAPVSRGPARSAALHDLDDLVEIDLDAFPRQPQPVVAP